MRAGGRNDGLRAAVRNDGVGSRGGNLCIRTVDRDERVSWLAERSLRGSHDGLVCRILKWQSRDGGKAGKNAEDDELDEHHDCNNGGR